MCVNLLLILVNSDKVSVEVWSAKYCETAEIIAKSVLPIVIRAENEWNDMKPHRP